MTEQYTGFRQAMAEGYLGDSKVFHNMFASPQTLDSRIQNILTGFQQHTDSATSDDLAMPANLRDFMRKIDPASQANRIAWVDYLNSIPSSVLPKINRLPQYFPISFQAIRTSQSITAFNLLTPGNAISLAASGDSAVYFHPNYASDGEQSLFIQRLTSLDEDLSGLYTEFPLSTDQIFAPSDALVASGSHIPLDRFLPIIAVDQRIKSIDASLIEDYSSSMNPGIGFSICVVPFWRPGNDPEAPFDITIPVNFSVTNSGSSGVIKGLLQILAMSDVASPPYGLSDKGLLFRLGTFNVPGNSTAVYRTLLRFIRISSTQTKIGATLLNWSPL